MKVLYEKLRKFRRYFIFICIFLIMLIFSASDIVSSKEFTVPLYIIENNDYSEIFIDKSIIQNYYVEKFTIKDKKIDKNIGISYIDNRFIIHQKLKNNNEYLCNIVLINKENNQKENVDLKINYVQGKFDFKRIKLNSYNASVSYDKRNLIFIDNIKVFGEDVSKIGNFDFNIYRNKSELENYKSKINFNDISLKPGTTYNIYCSIELKNGVTVISKQKIKTKDFKIDELESKMIDDRKIKIDWKISDKNIKFQEGDSIKVYVKLLKDYNYSQTPNIEINNLDEYSAIVEAKEISPKYEVKLVYDIAGKSFEKIVEQVNNFYNINSEILVKNPRLMQVKFSFDKSYKFNNEQSLNLYLIEGENDITHGNKIFTSKINDIKFSPSYKFEYNELNPGRNYKLIYEISYEDGSVLKIKEDNFTTPLFNIKNIDVNSFKDKKGDSKINLKWELNDPKVKFSPKDSLSIYIKNNSISEYNVEPFYYQDKNLDNLNSLSLNTNELPNGEYEVKLIYDLNGNKYSKVANVNINFEGNDFKFFNGTNQETTEENIQIPEPQKTILKNQKDLKIKVVPSKITPTEIELEFLYNERVDFENGDTLVIKYKEKDQKDWIIYENYIHNRRPQIYPREQSDQTQQEQQNEPTQQNSQTPQGNNVENNNNGNTKHEINFENIETVVLSNLIPNKEYDFEITFNTHDIINKSTQTAQQSEDHQTKNEETEEQKNEIQKTETVEAEKQDQKSVAKVKSGKVDEEVERTNTKIDLKITTENFEIQTFVAETVRTNSAVLNWTLNFQPNTFEENDKVEIFVKRKIVGGYPAGSSFSKTGSELNGLTSAEIIVSHMKMEYTAKIVYTISGKKFEKTVDFTTGYGAASCSISNINEHSAILNIEYPKDYKFLENDYIEIYLKDHDEKKYDVAIMSLINIKDSKLEDITSVNLSYLKPKMSYDVLIKFINKANDIPDCTANFITSGIVLEKCRIDSINGDKLIVKTDFKNNKDIMRYLQLDVSVFYKKPEEKYYKEDPLVDSLRNEEGLDMEVQLPNICEDYDLLVSFNPHGLLSKYYIEFELEYRPIKPTVNISSREENGIKHNVYDLNWTYPENVQFATGDKINIYLREIQNEVEGNTETTESNSNNQQKLSNRKDSMHYLKQNSNSNEVSSNNVNTSEYQKIHTIDSDLLTTNTFNLDYFLNDNKKYEVIIQPVTKNYKFGIGKVDLTVGKKQEEEKKEDIFDTPINVETYEGSGGNTLTFSLPENVQGIDITDDTNIISDIEGLKFSLNEDGQINVKGLVPGKNYEKIEVRVVVEEGKEILFSFENIKLEPEEEVQGFLFNVYQRSFLRDPDEGGYNYWIDRLKERTITSRDFLINLLFAEKEFSEMEYSTDKLISVLYSIIVNRDPDKEGLNFWINFYNNEAIKNANGNVFAAKKFIVDRMINEKEFEKLMVSMGVEY